MLKSFEGFECVKVRVVLMLVTRVSSGKAVSKQSWEGGQHTNKIERMKLTSSEAKVIVVETGDHDSMLVQVVC